ncbi:unnamed protein product [Hymenolepis diminuta]|uniref:TFIIS central domain-containing protein n=1 Tax=Hymenolepis diminuta TaxID=6216 RepID=A0A0R3SPU2_HYMDI|nr:unnamed protein product [Hymenolepis diminuta]
MARNILDNVQFSQTYKDQIRKEEDAIYKFFVKHKDSYCSPEILGTASKVIRKKMEMSSLKHDRCNAILKAAEERREKEEAEYEKKAKERERDELELGSSSMVDLMRPVSPDVKATLYEGISAEDGGRTQLSLGKSFTSYQVTASLKDSLYWFIICGSCANDLDEKW